jgi:hypothetical protein
MPHLSDPHQFQLRLRDTTGDLLGLRTGLLPCNATCEFLHLLSAFRISDHGDAQAMTARIPC